MQTGKASLSQVVEVLGGQRVFGRETVTDAELIQAVRAGLPHAALESVTRTLNTPERMPEYLLVSKRTLARRKKEDRLSAEESDRLVRLARVLARAIDVFGSRDRAVDWLQDTHPALGHQTPLSLLDTDLGVREVETVLTRIEYGVFS